MSDEIMIRVEHLEKTFSTRERTVEALRDINLEIIKGEIFGIIGYSGAGKSTLIRCFNMLEPPTGGTVFVDGKEITKLSKTELREERKQMGMIFQHFNLLSSRTVRANIAYPLEVAGWQKEKINSRVSELLELVGLSEEADAYPAQLSGGQKQRVGIARAIANNPKVLLCDEATSALDPKTTLSILELLKDINQRLNLTMVVITHEMEVIKHICDRVAIIDEGEIAEFGTVLELFSEPKTDIAHEFLKQVSQNEVPVEIMREFLQKESPSFKLLQLSFLGESTGNPVISELIKRFDLEVNILQGQIERIQEVPYGKLLVSLEGSPEKIDQALSYLKERGIKMEVPGYGA